MLKRSGMAMFIFDLWSNICLNIVHFWVICKNCLFFVRWEKCYLGNDVSDTIKLVLTSIRMIKFVLILQLKCSTMLIFYIIQQKLPHPLPYKGNSIYLLSNIHRKIFCFTFRVIYKNFFSVNTEKLHFGNSIRRNCSASCTFLIRGLSPWACTV